MMDVFTKRKRSGIMSRISSKNSQQEIFVGNILKSLGCKYIKHLKTLPGTPDFIISKNNKVIFVHGCFWHGHKKCSRSVLPQTHRSFWKDKISKNIKRDKKSLIELKRLGWDSMIIWQCDIKKRNLITLENRVIKFLKQ